MNIEGFMIALGEIDLVQQIKECFKTNTSMSSALYDKAMMLYRKYLVVGGMRECVKQFLETNDYILYMVEELNDFKGGMSENYVNVQLMINGYQYFYWESERGAEIDFIIQREGKIIPIEVKAADNTKAKSLKLYIQPEDAIKLSTKNFGFKDKKKIVPLYAAFSYKQFQKLQK